MNKNVHGAWPNVEGEIEREAKKNQSLSDKITKFHLKNDEMKKKMKRSRPMNCH